MPAPDPQASAPPPSTAAGSKPPDIAPAPAQDGSDSALASYQRQLWAHIAARRPGGINLPGIAMIRFAVDEGGRLASVELAATSGNAALDRLALRTVRNAAPFPAPPRDAHGDRPVFLIPFSFH